MIEQEVYEYRVMCPDGEERVGSALRPSTDREHTVSWTLRNANATTLASSHGSRCPGVHVMQRRPVGEWEDCDD